MKYENASNLLPEALVQELQKYIQGGYLYVPARKGQRKAWGECSGSRKELAVRDAQIKQAYAQGLSIEELSRLHFLSVDTIKKIIYRK